MPTFGGATGERYICPPTDCASTLALFLFDEYIVQSITLRVVIIIVVFCMAMFLRNTPIFRKLLCIYGAHFKDITLFAQHCDDVEKW